MVWAPYHTRGELGPQVQCLDTDDSTVLLDYTWTDVAAAALPACDNVAPVMRESFPLDERIRTGLDGEKIVEVGGYYYRASLEFKLLDKSSAGQVQSVLNHCAKGGQYKVKFFPHSDNTAIYFICHLKGNVGDMDLKGRPFAGGHSGQVTVIGLERFKEVPWPVSRGMKFMAVGSWGAYSAAEKENSQMGDISGYGAYSDAEKESTLGYQTDTSSVVEFD